MRRALRAICLVATALACSRAVSKPEDTKFLAVFVSRDGVIEVNQREASLHELEQALQAAVGAQALVLYAREPPERDRASISMMVLRMVRDRGLRVRLCRNRDFSDAVTPDGKLRPE